MLTLGDIVLADCGFTCQQEAQMVLAEKSPIHKRTKTIRKKDIDWSREVSVVRIHVERVIRLLNQKYTILQGVLPISLIAGDNLENTADKIRDPLIIRLVLNRHQY